MSEILDLEEKTAPHVEATTEGGESSRTVPKGSDDQSERPMSPSINGTPTSSDKESEQSVPVSATGQQFDERIENLVSLFRDFLEAAPNRLAFTSSHPGTQQNAGRERVSGLATAEYDYEKKPTRDEFGNSEAAPNKVGRTRVFGLAKGFSQETGSNNKYDYERKYPPDEFGKEAAESARIWLTYLDEAEAFDRERAEGWKETVDVLLVFAGLFSGVITTFISQASQSLQRDNTQVSASLLFEAVQLLRASFSGVPASDVPVSTLTPTSPFTASTNTLLVNGLWFTSLAITLSVALFAVLAKQWLYYYLSSIPGTANEKARARQLRFNGFESWRVAAIVDLLPILLHLAVGMFLTGIIILLFPLDVHVAWTIVIIAGVTFTLYFISVMLPIWCPECPYTTSLTIYIGILLFCLRKFFQKINKGFQAVWIKTNFKIRFTVEHLAQSLVRHGSMFISNLARAVRSGSHRLRSIIFSDDLPGFTKWREENIKQAVKNATFLDFEAVNWLYVTSQNRSVHRIIAQCAAVHPIIRERLEWRISQGLFDTLEASTTNIVDLRHGLCFYLPFRNFWRSRFWSLFRIPNGVESQLEEGEYQSYLRIAETASQYKPERQILLNAIDGDFSLPLTMWCHLLEKTSTDATVAAHILTPLTDGLFNWGFNPARDLIHDAGLTHLNSVKLGWWKFQHLFRYFKLENPNYSSEAKTDQMCYLLLITIYRNLTSDDPLITDKEKRQGSLENVFHSFRNRVFAFSHRSRQLDRLEVALRFFTEICCVDSFWCESMTDKARGCAACFLFDLRISINTLIIYLPLTDSHDLSLIYQGYSRDINSYLSYFTPPLFVPQNRRHLSTILLNDPAQNQVSNFSKCLHNLENSRIIDKETSLYPILMDLLKSVGPKEKPLFTILYHPSVLLQLWKLIALSKCDTNKYFLLLESKVDGETLDELFASINELLRSYNHSENSPYGRQQWNSEVINHIRSASPASAREFKQLEVTAGQSGQSGPGNAASGKDYDTEERAQVSERRNYHFITNWMKKVFESIWPKTPSQ